MNVIYTTMLGVLILLAAMVDTNAGVYPSAPPAENCTEDMACWNCATMGNQTCGPGATWTMIDPEIGTALTCVLTDYRVICLEEE